jgi:hypothetical protein
MPFHEYMTAKGVEGISKTLGAELASTQELMPSSTIIETSLSANILRNDNKK